MGDVSAALGYITHMSLSRDQISDRLAAVGPDRGPPRVGRPVDRGGVPGDVTDVPPGRHVRWALGKLARR